MDRQDIIKFCAEFWQVDHSVIEDNLKLDDKSLPNNSSIRFYQFIARLEAHFGAQLENAMEIRTFGDICQSLSKSNS
jgi:acyl carrier protein